MGVGPDPDLARIKAAFTRSSGYFQSGKILIGAVGAITVIGSLL